MKGELSIQESRRREIENLERRIDEMPRKMNETAKIYRRLVDEDLELRERRLLLVEREAREL